MVLVERSDSIGDSKRTTCRRCRVKLAAPTSNPLSAFCCKGCVRLHYRAQCVICEGRKSGKGLACNHPRCQSELAARKRHDALGMVWGSGRAKLGSADPTNIGVSEDVGPVRGGRQVAGSPLSPNDLHLVTLRDPFKHDSKLNKRHWLEADRAEIAGSGDFADIDWSEVFSADGVRCFVADAARTGAMNPQVRQRDDGRYQIGPPTMAPSPLGARASAASVANHEATRSAWLHRNSRHREGITNG